MQVLFLGAEPFDLLNNRFDLINQILKKDIKVIASSSFVDKKFDINIKNSNFVYKPINIKRHGLQLTCNLRTFFNLLYLFKKYQPNISLAYGIKLIIWGGIAARVTNTPFYALITGLGFAFQGHTFKRRLLTKLVIFLYKIALKNSNAVIFQNKENCSTFVDKFIIPKSKTFIINGSGVDIKKFSVSKFPVGSINFLCIARLLGEKGLREYAAAAKIVKKKFPSVNFNLLGQQDSSLDAILLKEVKGWSSYLNYFGHTNDVRPYISQCHVFVLPSYHEGIPRSTLEAMSMGRPIITTDAVGCKETVEEGKNGFKVPIKSIMALKEKLIWFIENPEQIKPMGLVSRKIVEEKFEINSVNFEILNIMGIK